MSVISSYTITPGSTLRLDPRWRISRLFLSTVSTTLTQTIYLRVRDSDVVLEQTINGSNWKYIDPAVIESIRSDPKNNNDLNLAVGISHQSYDAEATLGTSSQFLINPTGDDSIWRLIEKLVPQGNTNIEQILVDEDVAAAGAGSGSTSSIPKGAIVHYYGGISQDTLGTSPHASYITLSDFQSNIVFKSRGALNYVFRGRFRNPVEGAGSFAYSNGDSVSHWFLLGIYVEVP